MKTVLVLLYNNRILKWGMEFKNKRKGRPLP